MTNGSLMKVESIANAPLEAFCNTVDLHKAIIGIDLQFFVFLRDAVLHRFYCILQLFPITKPSFQNMLLFIVFYILYLLKSQ